MTPRQANLVTALGLAALLAVVSLSAPRWAERLRAPLAGGAEDEASARSAAVGPEAAASEGEAARKINVRLFFEAGDRDGLVAEERAVAHSSDLARQIQTVVEELARGPSNGLEATLAPQTRVLQVFVTARGVAYVSLSREATAGLPGGSKAELLTVYSVVDTIAANFPAISRVQLLIEDRSIDSLGGHVDLSRPLAPDMSLLALPGASPAETQAPLSPPA
jgi:spore germination protein GerM